MTVGLVRLCTVMSGTSSDSDSVCLGSNPSSLATLPFAVVRIEAAINAGLDFRRCAMKPRPAKPRSSMAHVEGSGTASTPEIEKAMLSTVPPQ